MKTAIHHLTLKEIITGNLSQRISNTALSSRVSVTPRIVEKYHQNLSGSPLFTSWFTSMMAERRIDIYSPAKSPRNVSQSDTHTDEYGTACYFGGSNILAARTDFDAVGFDAMQKIGARFIFTDTPLPTILPGENPFLVINTKTGGSEDFSILNQFVRPEDCITIYDKFINDISIELIEHLAKQLTDNSSLRIFHFIPNRAGRNLLSTQQINLRIAAANPGINLLVKECSAQFAKDNHDRYMFLGNRCQINFSAGMDCFGSLDPTSGKRRNRKSTITFFDTSRSDLFSITAKDGTSCEVSHYID